MSSPLAAESLAPPIRRRRVGAVVAVGAPSCAGRGKVRRLLALDRTTTADHDCKACRLHSEQHMASWLPEAAAEAGARLARRAAEERATVAGARCGWQQANGPMRPAFLYSDPKSSHRWRRDLLIPAEGSRGASGELGACGSRMRMLLRHPPVHSLPLRLERCQAVDQDTAGRDMANRWITTPPDLADELAASRPAGPDSPTGWPHPEAGRPFMSVSSAVVPSH